jgi:hypothetical protein
MSNLDVLSTGSSWEMLDLTIKPKQRLSTGIPLRIQTELKEFLSFVKALTLAAFREQLAL